MVIAQDIGRRYPISADLKSRVPCQMLESICRGNVSRSLFVSMEISAHTDMGESVSTADLDKVST